MCVLYGVTQFFIVLLIFLNSKDKENLEEKSMMGLSLPLCGQVSGHVYFFKYSHSSFLKFVEVSVMLMHIRYVNSF